MACEEDILEWSRSLIICASSAKEGTVLTQCFGYDIMLMSLLKMDDEGLLFSLSGVVEGFEDSSIVAEFGCISLMMNCFCACGRTRWCVLFVCRGDPSEAADDSDPHDDDSDPHDDDMCSLFDRVCCSLFDRVCSLFDRVCSLFDRVCSLFDRVCSLFDRVCHSVEDSKSAAGSRRDAPHEVPHWLFFFVVFFFSECYFFVICYFFVFLFELLPFASVCLYRACLRVDDSKSGRRTLLKGGEL